jgi:hypothetical protein
VLRAAIGRGFTDSGRFYILIKSPRLKNEFLLAFMQPQFQADGILVRIDETLDPAVKCSQLLPGPLADDCQ